MTTIVTRSGKGSPLDATDHDNNLNNLNNDKVEKTRVLNTAAPLTGGGDLSADRTFGVTQATDLAVGVVELATAAEAAALTDLTRALTPGAMPISSETQKGVVELATAAETTAGASNVLAVHPAGLKVELDKKANLAGATFTGAVTVQAAATSSAPAQLQQVRAKNGIVNGALLVWQDGVSFTGIESGAYVADNLKYEKVGAMVHDAARVAAASASVYPGAVFHRARLTLTTAQAALAAGDFNVLTAYIEGYQWARYAADQFTLQFVVKLPVAGTYCLSIRNSAADYSYVSEFSYTTANTDQLVTLTIPAPTVGAWDYSTGIGAIISLCLGSGATLQGAVGWQAANKIATANQVNGLNAAAGSVYELALLRIDAGSVALKWAAEDFDYASVARQCYRFYWRQGGARRFTLNSVATGASQDFRFSFELPVEMRAVPTITKTGTWGLINCSDPTAGNITTTSFILLTSSSAAGAFLANTDSADDELKISARF